MISLEKDSMSIVSEKYRALRTNIEYSFFDNETKIIVITSSIPGEGKSTVASNIALSLAENGNETLLIDCDLRRPSIHKKFDISGRRGLSNVLIGELDFNDAVIEHGEYFDILLAGKIPPNPSEMLSSRRMQEFLDNMREYYSYIILDTPPVQAVTDSKILSTKADGTLLVVKAESTKKDAVLKAIGDLNKVKANIIGTVLNEASMKTNYEYYYYYGSDTKEK